MIKSKVVTTQTITVPLSVRTVKRVDGTVLIGNSTSNPAPFGRYSGEAATINTYTGKDGRFRPVKHTRKRWDTVVAGIRGSHIRASANGTLPTSLAFGSTTGSTLHNYAKIYPFFVSKANALAIINVDSVQWDALAIQSLQTMLPAISGENSLLNSLLELKDFKRVFGAIGARGLSLISSIKNGLRNNLYDRPLSRLAAGHLEYSFAWKPLFGEIVKMWKTLQSFDQTIQAIINRADTPQQRYYGTSITGTGTPLGAPSTGDRNVQYDGSTAPNGYLSPNTRFKISTAFGDNFRYHATVRYRYPLPPGLKTYAGKAKSYLDAIGINGNPAILWNAIPFSFLIDWFVNVGQILNGFRVDNNPIKCEILDFAHSVRAWKAVQLEIADGQIYSGTVATYDYYVTDRCQVTTYERRTGVPNLRNALLTSGLNAREAVLATSLGISFRRGRRR